MGSNSLSVIRSINLAVLTPIVCKLLCLERFEIQSWKVRQLQEGFGNPVSLGLYRFEGTGQDQDDQHISWSVVLKIVQSPANAGLLNFGEAADPTHWNYWKRESLVYSSGLLEMLPSGMAAPCCFGIAELPGDIIWLWLEDVQGDSSGTWTLESYTLAARHLGQFNGLYSTEHSFPSFPWYSRHRIQQWLSLIPWQSFPWEHPRVLAHYPQPESNSFQHMLVENERFLQKLEGLPQTICHGDTYPTNFKSRRLSNGQSQIVALDWQLAGIGPLGADLGQLVLGAQTNLKEADPAQVAEVLFENYLDGLRESGCKVEPQLVRFGYAAFAAMQVGLFNVYLLNESLKQTEGTEDAQHDRLDIPYCFEVVTAKEAYKLVDEI